MEEIDGILQEYVATANNPKYKGDFNVINSKFPELKSYDKGVLEEYVATANNPKYKGDFGVINSKFPEFFTVKKKRQYYIYHTKSKIGFGTENWFFGYSKTR